LIQDSSHHPGRGGGGYGGSGGSVGSGGAVIRQLKHDTENPDEKQARLKARNDQDKRRADTESQDKKEARIKARAETRAAWSPEEIAALNKKRRDRRNRVLSVQAATHLLFALLFPQCAALLVDRSWRLINFSTPCSTQASSRKIKARSLRFRSNLPSLVAKKS